MPWRPNRKQNSKIQKFKKWLKLKKINYSHRENKIGFTKKKRTPVKLRDDNVKSYYLQKNRKKKHKTKWSDLLASGCVCVQEKKIAIGCFENIQ